MFLKLVILFFLHSIDKNRCSVVYVWWVQTSFLFQTTHTTMAVQDQNFTFVLGFEQVDIYQAQQGIEI